MSEIAFADTAGRFATARKGGPDAFTINVAADLADRGVSLANIARITGYPESDLSPHVTVQVRKGPSPTLPDFPTERPTGARFTAPGIDDIEHQVRLMERAIL